MSECLVFTHTRLKHSDIENSDFLKLIKTKKFLSKFSSFIYTEVKNFDLDWTETAFK